MGKGRQATFYRVIDGKIVSYVANVRDVAKETFEVEVKGNPETRIGWSTAGKLTSLICVLVVFWSALCGIPVYLLTH